MSKDYVNKEGLSKFLGKIKALISKKPDMIELTQAEYDDLETKDPNVVYAISDSDETLDTLSNAIRDVDSKVEQLNSEMSPIVQNISNPNLLDNSFFTVNQRGRNEYNAIGYTVDRWYLYQPHKLTIHDGYVTFSLISAETQSRYLVQKLDTNNLNSMLGKELTLSLKLRSGEVFGASGIIPTNPIDGDYLNSESSDGHYKLYLRYKSGTYFEVRFGNNDMTPADIVAIKLEYGTVSTLANDSAPNYQTELLKCLTSTADPNDTYANKSVITTKDILSKEDIAASSDLTGKVPSAAAFKSLNSDLANKIKIVTINIGGLAITGVGDYNDFYTEINLQEYLPPNSIIIGASWIGPWYTYDRLQITQGGTRIAIVSTKSHTLGDGRRISVYFI